MLDIPMDLAAIHTHLAAVEEGHGKFYKRFETQGPSAKSALAVVALVVLVALAAALLGAALGISAAWWF